MLNKTYKKNILREIRSTRSRFFSIFGIVMLGVVMLTGLMSVAPDMRSAGDAYFRESNLCDLRIISTLGLTREDVCEIGAVEGVHSVMPVKSVDAEVQNAIGDTLIMRAQALPQTMDETDDAYINRLMLKEGRLPEAANECAVHPLGFVAGIALGDTITLPEQADGLAGCTYTVVGIVQTPTNFSIDTESTTVGDGSLDFLAFMRPDQLTADYYTTCYLTVEGAASVSTYTSEYDDLIAPVADRLERLGSVRTVLRREQVVGDAQAELDKAKQEYEDQKAEAEQKLADARAELEQAEQKLADARKKLEQGEKEYTDGQRQLAQQKQQLPDTLQSGADQVLISEQQVLDFEDRTDQIALAVEMLKIMQPTLEYAGSMLDSAAEQIARLDPDDPNLEYYQRAYDSARSLYDTISGKMQEYQAQLDAVKQQLYAQGLITSPDISNEELQAQCSAVLKKMKLALTQGQLSISTATAAAYAAFEQAEQQLADARAELDEGWQQYDSGCAELEDGWQQYRDAKAEADRKLADAADQITDAQETIDDIAACEWYVLDRDTLTSFVTFEQNADRIADIAKVFPVFFFLVAALVALTTMTRMVEENRLQIGALKALGYSEQAITAKYLIYALLASSLGALAGILVGFSGFPAVIWYAYSIMYQVPGFKLIYYPWLIVVSLVASTAVISAATLNVCRTSLSERPASLLMPKAPAAGKRIFLEYITPLWQRMSFSYKVTARNLLRYKKRFFMTVIGVAGCTALLLVGFGLQDSIMEVVDYQFEELNHYDLSITITSEKALEIERGLSDILADRTAIESSGLYYSKTVTVCNAEGQESSMTLMLAQDPQQLAQYFTFRTRRGHDPIPFDENSVILTEKTAETLGVDVGDSIRLETESGRVALTVTGITENYVFSRIFVGSKAYQHAVGELPAWNTVLAKSAVEESESARTALTERILQQNYVSGAVFIEDASSTFTNVISCINYVVLLVIACAAALAAIVLYNLININIAERKKELATIKVLGFYDREVHRYIFREIDILAFIGSLVGLGIGAPLHQFIIRTVEIDQMMFIRSISLSSYVYSVVLTMVFTVAVSLWMRRQVNAISMVESMKAPE